MVSIRRGYEPRPSQTRQGQRVDNPFLDTTATGEIQSLVHYESQDKWHGQELQNADFRSRLDANHRNWKDVAALKLPDALHKLTSHGVQIKIQWAALVGLAVMVWKR